MDCDCDFYFSPVKAEKSCIDNFKVLFEEKEDNGDECKKNVLASENEIMFGKGNCEASPYYQILKKKIEEKQKDKTKGNVELKRKENKKYNTNNKPNTNTSNNNKLKRSIKEIKNKEKKKV